MWGLAAAAGVALIAAVIACVTARGAGARSPRGAAALVLVCSVLSLLGFGYEYIAGESVIQALQAGGGTGVVGFGTGGWLMVAGAVLAIVGAFLQFGAQRPVMATFVPSA
jgi:hypothetical protein